MNNDEPIFINTEIFKNESQLREFIGLIPNRMIGAGSKINSYSKDFIRETWDRIKWIEIFSRWWSRYQNRSNKITFNEFIKQIDPEEEFYKHD